MVINNKNLDNPQSEDSKQNLSESISKNLPSEDEKQNLSPKQSKKAPEETITLSSGKVFSKKRYAQLKTALGASTTLVMPSGMFNDGSDGYEYFWASTQYAGQIDKKKDLGYEVCTNKDGKEYRHFAGMDGSERHEHVLMRIKIEDKQILSEIRREKKALSEIEQIIPDSSGIFENKSRLEKDGELTLEENLQNKYNSNKIKQI